LSRPNRRQQGFTLVEAMVGTVLLTMITVAMAGTFLVAYRTLTNEARVVAADTAASHASFTLTRDLASATTVPTGTVSSSSTVTLTYGAPLASVVYSLNANNELIRTVNGSPQVAARDVTSVVMTATGCYATATIQPSATSAAAFSLNVANRPGGCF